MAFDLVLRGGPLVDGSGGPARTADVGVARRPDHRGRRPVRGRRGRRRDRASTPRASSWRPGFVDPHGHSDGTLFLDGALASHLHQGYTTQLSGNCGYTYAPLDARSRPGARADLEALGLDPAWASFGDYLDAVDRVAARPERRVPRRPRDGPRRRCSGPDDRAPDDAELAAMVRHVDEALDAGAVGVSSGPHLRAGDARRARRGRGARRGRVPAGRACTPPTCATSRTACSARSTRRSRPRGRASDAAGRPGRLQVSHLKAGAKIGLGPGSGPRRADRARPARRPRRRGATSTRTPRPRRRSPTLLPPAILALDPEDAAAAIREPATPHARSATPRRRASAAGRTWPPTRAGTASSSRAARRGPSGAAAASPTIADDARRRPVRARARRPRRRPAQHRHRASTAWPSPTSRRSCACPGSRSAPTPSRPPARPPDPRRGRPAPARPTARRRASSAATCASGACSRSRPRSRS